MLVSEDGTQNVLTDHRREAPLQSARQLGTEVDGKGYDWGLITSFANPYNSSYRIVLLAGIHGTGTVGAADHVCDLTELRKLVSRTDSDAICDVVRVNYDGDRDTPTYMQPG
jgi:hypothetical protein